MHSVRAANEFGSGGKYFLKPSVYRPKKGAVEELYPNSSEEHVAFVKKVQLQHWALRGLPQEFKVFARNRWDPHPVNITNLAVVRENYRILVESERGPQIIEHENALAIQFVVSPKYPESVQVLANFVRKRALDIFCTVCITSSQNSHPPRP